ncbi:hypothetical protein TRIUR3_03941 [Triticum urartu]|uniref:Uncharacterized protein n=1 Tax=Triticum urartu TaxID=4572 RepID=M8A8Z3_TRIUA|nr:hypothetical protein TRIUR3_03941 [Triticum urartu]
MELYSARGGGAGREDVVSRPQPRLCGARRGHHERRDGAEAEEHETVAAMLCSEVSEGDVREGANEVQVADDGEPLAGRRQPAQQLFSGSRRRRREAAHDQEDKKRADEQDKDQS